MAFAAIGNLRSVIPEGTKIMALTATATRPTFESVVSRLSMENVAVVGASSVRDNIRYSVHPMMSMDEFCYKIAEDVRTLGIRYPKTVIFCRKYSDCASLYFLFRAKLGTQFTHPADTLAVQEFRLVDMYTAASTLGMRQKLLASFIEQGSTLRILIATMAFGMGVDCRDIRQIIHWSPPMLIEDYVQETGHAGRDGLLSEATLIYGHIHRDVSFKMKLYGNKVLQCRRKTLFADFMFCSNDDSCIVGCSCCDVCAKSCSCGQCRPFLQLV